MENNDIAKQEEIFKKGLVALILAWITGVIGLILAIINKKNIKEYVANGGQLVGKAKTGNILTTIALVLGIIYTIIVVLYIIIFVVAGAAAVSMS
ncbi:MAG: hypothetical protein J6U54_02035 [Clostridiales bacterium]|nr:hypothetical protein [Clostridiales bacterium]